MKNYYQIIGIDKKASAIEIKKGFRRKALLTHPDKTKTDSIREFVNVYEAYAVLTDKKKRSNYDKQYDLVFNSIEDRIKDEDINNDHDLKQIAAKGQIYAENYDLFRKEILWPLLSELLFSHDRLFPASLLLTFVGLWTIGKGIWNLDFIYSLIGIILTFAGLYLAKWRTNYILEIREM